MSLCKELSGKEGSFKICNFTCELNSAAIILVSNAACWAFYLVILYVAIIQIFKSYEKYYFHRIGDR